jgi:hypothetical protein
MDEALIYINVFKILSYYNHNLLKFSYKSMFENSKTYSIWNILFIHFKIPQTLCVANHKFNGEHQRFIMKVKEVLNKFFHVYAINVIVNTCMRYFFWHILPCFHPPTKKI